MSESVNEQAPVSNWNIANAFTMLRLFLVPVFVWLMLAVVSPQDSLRWWALAVFVVAAITDKVDGSLARRYGLITDFGKLTDSIADKLLTLSAFILLSWAGVLWWWVTILILVRELGITVMRMFMKHIAVMSANQGGRIKATLQMLLIVALLVPWDVLTPGAWPGIMLVGRILSVLVALVTVGTGLWYVRDAATVYRAAKN